MKKTYSGPDGITLVLDSSEIFPNDPGQGTPAMVYTRGGGATYWCASDTGTVMDARGNDVDLSVAQCEWLDTMADTVDAFIDTNFPGR